MDYELISSQLIQLLSEGEDVHPAALIEREYCLRKILKVQTRLSAEIAIIIKVYNLKTSGHYVLQIGELFLSNDQVFFPDGTTVYLDNAENHLSSISRWSGLSLTPQGCYEIITTAIYLMNILSF